MMHKFLQRSGVLKILNWNFKKIIKFCQYKVPFIQNFCWNSVINTCIIEVDVRMFCITRYLQMLEFTFIILQ